LRNSARSRAEGRNRICAEMVVGGALTDCSRLCHFECHRNGKVRNWWSKAENSGKSRFAPSGRIRKSWRPPD